MRRRTVHVTRAVLVRAGMCLVASGAIFFPPPSTATLATPVIFRGVSSVSPSKELPLAYEVSFPNGSLEPSVDKLNIGPMQVGDTQIPGSNPTFATGPGDIILGITRPVDLSPDLVVAQSVWATGLHFGPGSILQIRATFIAPVGPIPGGGFAIGLGAKTGGAEDLPDEPRVFSTVNVRPGFLVRLNVPFGSAQGTSMVLPQSVKDAIFSATDPQPFTLEVTVDRLKGTGKSKLTVAGQTFTLHFVLSDFLANGGPLITAAGPGIAVNSNGPGKTASVHVRDFRIYTNVGG